MQDDEKRPIQQLGRRMDALAGEIVVLKRDDPRRAEIINEVSRLGILRASLKGKMEAHEVSKRVNNPKYDAPHCSAPVED